MYSDRGGCSYTLYRMYSPYARRTTTIRVLNWHIEGFIFITASPQQQQHGMFEHPFTSSFNGRRLRSSNASTALFRCSPVQSSPGHQAPHPILSIIIPLAKRRPSARHDGKPVPMLCCVVGHHRVQRWNYYDCCFAAILNPPPSIHSH